MYSRVYIEITNICNMNCSFCHGHKRAPRMMTEEEFAHILSQLEGKTRYIYYHLMGEPLSHPLLPRFLLLAKESGFLSQITTNGTLIKKHGDMLIDFGVHKVNISLHSFENGGKTEHIKYLKEVTDFALDASYNGTIVVLRLWNNGYEDEKNKEVIEYLKDRIKGEWQDNNRGIKLKEKLFLEWGERFDWPDISAPEGSPHISCYGMRDHFGVLCDGTVVPCCLDSDGVIALGNIYIESLEEILNSQRAKAIKSSFENRNVSEELCLRCGYARRFI